MANCPQCGAKVGPHDIECKYCASPLTPSQSGVNPQPAIVQQNTLPNQQPVNQQNINITVGQDAGFAPRYKDKSKVAAALLAIFLGAFGAHKFYLGKTGMGFIYLLFCWTYIPGLVGFVEGIIYLVKSDESFREKYCRIN